MFNPEYCTVPQRSQFPLEPALQPVHSDMMLLPEAPFLIHGTSTHGTQKAIDSPYSTCYTVLMTAYSRQFPRLVALTKAVRSEVITERRCTTAIPYPVPLKNVSTELLDFP